MDAVLMIFQWDNNTLTIHQMTFSKYMGTGHLEDTGKLTLLAII